MSNGENSLWPALSWEEEVWQPTARTWRMRMGPEGLRPQKYQCALPSSIASVNPSLPADIVVTVSQAEAELLRIDTELAGFADHYGPLLLRSEAASSSQIENLAASARAILTAELGAKSSKNSGQIVANARAVKAAIDLAIIWMQPRYYRLILHSWLINRSILRASGEMSLCGLAAVANLQWVLTM